MASTNLAMQRYKEARRMTKKKSSSEKTQQEKLQNQVSNYQTRLRAAGIQPEEATDNRNFLEKLLNLPEDQNVLFDVLEIINRPQQALFGAIDNAINNEDVLSGAWEGLSGQKQTSGSEILRDAGMGGSGDFNLFDPSTYGDLSASDVLGFGLDIFADPIDPFLGKIAKGVGKGVKKVAGIGDDIIEKTLTKVDNANLKKINKFIEKNGGTIDDAAKALGIGANKLDNYKALKTQLGKAVNSSENLLGLTGKAREAQNIAEVNTQIGNKVVKNLDNDINNIVKQTAKTTEEATKKYKEISDALMTHVENAYDFSIKGDDVLKQLKKGKRIDFFNDEAAKSIVDNLKEYGIKASNDGRFVTLLDNNRKLNTLTGESSNKVFGQYLSAEDLLDREAAEKLLNSTPELQQLAKKAENTFSNLASTSDTLTGLKSADITKEGYVRHGLSDEAKEIKQAEGIYPSRNKAFKKSWYFRCFR